MIQVRQGTPQDYEAVYTFIHGNQTEEVLHHFNDENDVATKLIAPLQLGLLLIGEENGKIVGICTVAFMSPEAEQAYVNDPEQDMEKEFWDSGDSVWLIFITALPGKEEEFFQTIMQQVGRALGRKMHFMYDDRVLELDFSNGRQPELDPSALGASQETEIPYDMRAIEGAM